MPRKPPDDPVFDAFWAVYPKRRPDPRAGAEACSTRSIKAGTATAEELTGAATAYAAEARRRRLIRTTTGWLRPSSATSAGATTSRRRRRTGSAAPPEPDTGVHPFGGLVDRVGIKKWSAWLRPLRLERHGEVQIVIAPTKFHADRIRAEFEPLIRQVVGRDRGAAMTPYSEAKLVGAAAGAAITIEAGVGMATAPVTGLLR